MLKFLLQTMFGTKEPNYYVISALLWMRSSLDSSLRGDFEDCQRRFQSLVLECRVLLDRSPAFVNLGIFFESANLKDRMQKLVWKSMDIATKRPNCDVWHFDFVLTCAHDGQVWTLTCGAQFLTILTAALFGRPWVVAVYTAAEGTEGDRWHKKPQFELWSTRQSHIRTLLEEASKIGQCEQARRNSMCAQLIRKESRSVEIDEDESCIPTRERP